MEETKEVSFDLMPYQQEAVEKIDKIFQSHRFAGVILPTGAGKSFIAKMEMLSAGENDYLTKVNTGIVNNASIMYVAPTNEILLQIERNIVKYILKQNVTGKSVQEIDAMVKDAFPNISLLCYASLVADMKSGEIDEYNPDLVILDEVHRSGGTEFEKAVATLLGCKMGENGPEYNPETSESKNNMKVLAISATPERDVDGRNMMSVWASALGYSKEEVENEEYLAMDMSLSDAVKNNIVIEPEVVHFDGNLGETDQYKHLVNLYNNSDPSSKLHKELRKTLDTINNEIIKIPNYDSLSIEEKEEKRFERSVETIIQAYKDKKLNPTGKYIIFTPHNRTKEGEEPIPTEKHLEKYGMKFKKMLEQAGVETELSYLSSAFSDAENRKTLNDFSNQPIDSGKMKFIIASDKLNEGVHVEGISGAFMERNISEGENTNKRAQTILFLQQIGRCIFAKTMGFNGVRPVIFDTANNFFIQNRDNPQDEYSKIDLFKLSDTQKEFVKLYNLALLNLPAKSSVVDRVPRMFSIIDILSRYGFKANNETINKKTDLNELLSKEPLASAKNDILKELEDEGLYKSGKKYKIGDELYAAKKSFWSGTKFFENYTISDIIKYGIIDCKTREGANELVDYARKYYLDLKTGFIQMGAAESFRRMNIITGSELGTDGRDIDGFLPGQFGEDGYDIDGYNRQGFNRDGIHKDTKTIHDKKGFMADGINILTGTTEDLLGYNSSGIRPEYRITETGEKTLVGGWSRDGLWHLVNEDGTFTGPVSKYSEGLDPKVDCHDFDTSGKFIHTNGKVNYEGFYQKGDCMEPYIEDGREYKYRNREGRDIDGFDTNNFDIRGVHRETGTRLNPNMEKAIIYNENSIRIKRSLDALTPKQKQSFLKLHEDGKFHYGKGTREYNVNHFNGKGINAITGEYEDIYGFSMIDYIIKEEKQRTNEFGFKPKDVPKIVGGKFPNSFYKTAYVNGRTFNCNILGTDRSGYTANGELHPSLDITSDYIKNYLAKGKTIEEFAVDMSKAKRMLVPEAKIEIKKAMNQAVTLYRICPDLQKSNDAKEIGKVFYGLSEDQARSFIARCPGLKIGIMKDMEEYTKQIQENIRESHDIKDANRTRAQSLYRQNDAIRHKIEAIKQIPGMDFEETK